jgi:hypothetical protein
MSKSKFELQINVGVRPEHKDALARLARLEGESQAYVVRRLIREAAQEAGVWPDTPKFVLANTEEPRDNGAG